MAKIKMPWRVDDLTTIPEALRDAYDKVGEEFVLDLTNAEGVQLEDAGELRRAHDRNKTKLTAATTSLAKFGDLDPDDAREAIAAQLEAAKNGPPDKDVDQRIRDAVAQREKSLAKVNATEADAFKVAIAKRDTALSTALIVAAANAHLNTAHEGASGQLVMPHILKMSRIVETDEGFDVRVRNAAGDDRTSEKKGAAGAFMGVGELIDITALEPWAAGAFPGTGASGTGERQGRKSTKQAGVVTPTESGMVIADPAKILSGELTVDIGGT